MYLDYILFAVGGALLLAALVLAVWLLRSKRRSQDYRRMIQDETQKIDVVATLQNTEANKEKLTVTQLLTTKTEVLNATTELLPETEKETFLLGEVKTEQILHVTELLQENESIPWQESKTGAGLDLSPLEGKYELIREIHGGGMSRVFLARHAKLGNEWIVKYVEGAALSNEAEVLKKLNHNSLPQIIDIFQTGRGVFLIERYIEGYSLGHVIELRQHIKENQICDWGLQLAQVLHYLHNLETPIIHCDLKPSNIMVTHDNRLVLIDFGISKRQGLDGNASGITYNYAAPEQFRGQADKREVTDRRFGPLPPDHVNWPIDQRTDLYSVGVILYELIAGHVPSANTLDRVSSQATPRFAAVIRKCLEVQPEQRFQSASELVQALEDVKSQRLTMARSLVMRRVAATCCAVALAGGLATSASGAYINQQENLSIVSMDPGQVVVTAQQSVQLFIQKTTPSGKVITLDPGKIQWSYSQDNIARLDGDRLVGLNVGETTLHGLYRNKVVTLNITVTEPIGDLTTIALRYDTETEVKVYAGNGKRDFVDGNLTSCSFVSPESMSADGKTLYISDSGVIRVLEGGEVSTVYLEPEFLTAELIRGYDNDLYVLTGPWEAEDGSYYGFLRISDAGAGFLYYTEAAWSVITDFAFSSDGTLWFIQQNLGTGITSLNTLNVDSLECKWRMDLPDSTCGMAFDEADNLYLSVPETGNILRVGKDETSWTYFAGVEGERHFIDGAIPNFYLPSSLAVKDNALYVLDFDTVRKITIEGEGALFTETLAGIPTEDTAPEVKLGEGCQTVLPASELASMAIDKDGKLLLNDPKNSVIYQIII